MNPILGMLTKTAGGGVAKQIGRRFGLSEDQTSSALNQLIPALMTGLQHNTAQEGGLDALIGALSRGNHDQYLDNPEMLSQQAAIDDGNSILGHILGSKDVSRSVAGQASAQTGIGADVLKQMLPVVATLVMGSLSKQSAAASVSAPAAKSPGLLSELLDQNRDGSVADDVVGMLGRFFGGR